MTLTHYVIVRADLPIGFQAAQIVHAAGESVSCNLPPNTNAVVLQVDSEDELVAIGKRLAKSGIPHVPIYEPDPPYNGAYTAIGIVPVDDRKRLKPIIGKLSLLGKNGGWCRETDAVPHHSDIAQLAEH